MNAANTITHEVHKLAYDKRGILAIFCSKQPATVDKYKRTELKVTCSRCSIVKD